MDAGICWIGDPCYILHKDKSAPLDDSDSFPAGELGENWSQFCDKLGDAVVKQFNYRAGHPGLGVCVSTGYGDGEYPVYVEVKHGWVMSVTVDFSEEDEEDDNEHD